MFKYKLKYIYKYEHKFKSKFNTNINTSLNTNEIESKNTRSNKNNEIVEGKYKCK